MKLTTQRPTAVVQRPFTLTDGPVIHAAGYRRAYQVEAGTITYTWEDGAFTVASRFDIHLAGHWIKRDGTHAKDSADRMRPGYVSYAPGADFTEQYRFLDQIIEMLRPGGDLTMTVLLDHETGA